jgi:DNA-binding Lrp family transcriptional regulator
MSWSAHVNVKWKPEAEVPKNWDWLNEWKEVKWAWSTMGDWDMTIWVDADSPETLEDFVNTKLRSKDWVWDTKSTWTKQVWAA